MCGKTDIQIIMPCTQPREREREREREKSKVIREEGGLVYKMVSGDYCNACISVYMGISGLLHCFEL